MGAPSEHLEDRRAAMRVPVYAQIHVKHGKYTFVMDVVNISRSGMLIDTCETKAPPWVRSGFKIEVTLDLPDVLEAPIDLDAQIVRVEPGLGATTPRFAVMFVDMDRPTRIRLDGLIAYAKGTPPPLPA